MVEAAVGHARRLGDVADAGVEEALVLEHLASGLDQRRPGPVALEGERLLGPGPRDGTGRWAGLDFRLWRHVVEHSADRAPIEGLPKLVAIRGLTSGWGK